MENLHILLSLLSLVLLPVPLTIDTRIPTSTESFVSVYNKGSNFDNSNAVVRATETGQCFEESSKSKSI